MHKLELQDVSKRFGLVVALKPTTISVREGEFLTLLGPSGSGKTTLLQLLSGLYVPDSGRILIDGKDATHQEAHKRDIGLVFQNYALFPHLTVAENVAFPLKMRKRPAAEIAERVRRVLELVRLPHMGDRLPKELSGGQQQRIALARCAVYTPSVILMDEPLGALDKKLRDQMQIEITRLHKELGATIIFVTHDQEEAMAMSDRICLMNEGGIEQIGTPDDLYFRPKSLFVGQFFGSPNVLRGKIVARDGDVAAVDVGAADLLRAPFGMSGLAVGDRAAVLVRPESVVIGAGQGETHNCLDACFDMTMVTGPMTRHHLRRPAGEELVCLSLTSARHLAHRPGEPLTLSWPIADGVLLPVPADGAAA
ncbi:MAG: spermidine/putrescine ABC transporter ATP-binding protein [Rhodovulum sulfidophilum]|uniref:Spermidine/putrescine ABC transporter ATP-binding protein n=1 Tax=Rhodovulum sulfidophilum TaxID=35806 RepID=A0A2W5N9L7_RHOSU|nr:MAG: spermidine/putrescine ABC transporter ATP-binding protein [Rhodovulum sulfidophilum]